MAHLYSEEPASQVVRWGIRVVRKLPFIDFITLEVLKNYLLAAESWEDTVEKRREVQLRARDISLAIAGAVSIGFFVVSLTTFVGYKPIDSALICSAIWIQVCLLARDA